MKDKGGNPKISETDDISVKKYKREKIQPKRVRVE